MAEKAWKDMTPLERAERMVAAKAAKKAEREAALAAPAPEPEPDEEELYAPPIVDAEPDPEPDAPVAVTEPDAMDPELRSLLVGLDPEVADKFSEEELRDILGVAKQKALDQKMEAARKSITLRAATQARIAAGLVDAEVLRSEEEQARLDEQVTFRVRLPSEGSGHKKRGIYLDGICYEHGRMYTRSRAVFETVNEIQSRAWQHEFIFRGLPVEQYQMMLEAVNAGQLTVMPGAMH